MLVIGTGAVASFLIPRLSAGGESLQVFGSPSERLAALDGDASLGAVSDPARVGQHETWLVVCKTWQNQEKLRQLASAPAPSRILVLQNGLEPEAGWSKIANVERGLMTYGVASLGPGQAVGGEAGEIAVPVGSVWADVFRRSGLRVSEAQDMAEAVWWKLVVNASLNVVAALGNLRNGEVLERPTARMWAGFAARQVAQVSGLFGLSISPDGAVRRMEDVARATAANVCSTLADLRSGRPTEYASINGAVLSLAGELPLEALRELDRRFSLIPSSGIVPPEVAL